MNRSIFLVILAYSFCITLYHAQAAPPRDTQMDKAADLGQEVADRGWLVFAGHPAEIDHGKLITNRQGRGPTDLYLCRPDGSQLQAITRTPDYSEYGAAFSHDGQRLLYRRLSVDREINHDLWGMFGELVVADADGLNPTVQGREGEFPWACWSPDDKQIACLDKTKGWIRVFDLATKLMVQELPAQGIYQQLFWSSDGRRLVGTANLVGRPWNIVVADMKGGKLTQVSRSGGNGGNCTPDWFKKDPHQVIYSNRSTGILPSLGGRADSYGFTTIMQGTTDGKRRKLVFACEGKHLYFACLSPDDKYVVCADDPQDTMVVGELHVLRLSDTPIIIGLKDLSELYPNANSGPVFDLKLPNGTPLRGFEPDWTYAEIARQ